MSFVSFSEIASKRGRHSQSSYVMASQSKRGGSESLELTFRVSALAMEKMGVGIGSRVDILHDSKHDLWMIRSMPGEKGGFGISGQKNKSGYYSTGAVRLTWREGFPLLSGDMSEKAVKRASIDESASFEDGAIIFKLD